MLSFWLAKYKCSLSAFSWTSLLVIPEVIFSLWFSKWRLVEFLAANWGQSLLQQTHPHLYWGNISPPTSILGKFSPPTSMLGTIFPTRVYIGGKFSLCVAQHIHQISSLIWPETQLISVQSSRLLLFRVEMNRRGLVLLKHKRCNHQISLLAPLQKRMAMIMLIIRMAPYDVKSVLDPGSDSILRDLFCWSWLESGTLVGNGE